MSDQISGFHGLAKLTLKVNHQSSEVSPLSGGSGMLFYSGPHHTEQDVPPVWALTQARPALSHVPWRLDHLVPVERTSGRYVSLHTFLRVSSCLTIHQASSLACFFIGHSVFLAHVVLCRDTFSNVFSFLQLETSSRWSGYITGLEPDRFGLQPWFHLWPALTSLNLSFLVCQMG